MDLFAFIDGCEEKMFDVLMSIDEDTDLSSTCGVAGEDVLVELLKHRHNLESLNELESPEKMGLASLYAEEIILWLYGEVESEYFKKGEVAADRFAIKSATRGIYLPVVELEHRECMTRQGDAYRKWNGKNQLQAAGLLPQMVEDLVGEQVRPVMLQLVNMLPLDKNQRHQDIDPMQWVYLKNDQYLVTQKRTAWLKDSRAFELLLKAFPRAIDFGSYSPSLKAPNIPDGYLPNIPVVFTTIRNKNGESAGCDGCGRYHPDAEPMKKLVQRYGATAFQIRALNEHGTFAKGIIVPDERCIFEETPEIWLDWEMCKGVKKAPALRNKKKMLRYETQMYVGVLRSWHKPGKINGGFELLENIKQNTETTEIIEELTCEAMERLGKGGIDKLLNELGQKDPNIELLLKLVRAANKCGEKLNPLSIPTIHELLKSHLGKKLYRLAQGTGIKGKRHVVCIDNGITPGKVVINGVRPGKVVAIYRFPTVLEQGLVTCEVQKPQTHHKVNGRIPANVIYMNPVDIVDKLYGDSDGDEVGVVLDKRVVALFEERLSNKKFKVEPKGEKFNLKTDSEDGEWYIHEEHTGDVGIVTILRSKLLAAGDIWGARAISLLIQEAVDSKKKHIIYSDWRLAADPNNWTKGTDGYYYFDHKLDTAAGHMPIREVSKWVTNRLKQFGVIINDVLVQNTLGWRWPGKRIDIEKWTDTFEASEGWDGGNLVHTAHDTARECWLNMTEEFSALTSKPNTDTKHLVGLINKLCQMHGEDVNLGDLTWEEYKPIRRAAGLTAFGTKFSNILNNTLTAEDKAFRIEYITLELQEKLRSISEESIIPLLYIWMMEMTPRWAWREGRRDYYVNDPSYLPAGYDNWQCNKPNHAYRAVAFPGSPVLKILGITLEAHCEFLNEERINQITSYCLKQRNPHKALSKIIWNIRKNAPHEQETGVPGWECPYCTKRLQDALVRKIRSNEGRKHRKSIGDIIRSLNQQNRESNVVDVNQETLDYIYMSREQQKAHLEELYTSGIGEDWDAAEELRLL